MPYGLAYDPNDNRLFVADQQNNRVLVYDVASISNGENAVNVLGQTNFFSDTYATTQSGLYKPRGLAYDPNGSRLFVADRDNNRLVAYDVASVSDGENAVVVLGQSSFITKTTAATQNGLNAPNGVVYDGSANLLYVADGGNNRVLLFSGAPLSTSISINGGATYASSLTATLALTATGASQVQVSESASFTGASYLTYTTALSFTLTAGDGARSLYARFRDGALGVSTAVSDTIIVDTTPPLTFTLGSPATGAYTNTASPFLSWEASSDATSGLAKYQLLIDGSLNRDDVLTTTTSITPSSALTDGLHTWGLAAVDNAGNSRASSTYTLTVDTVAPSLSGVGSTGVTTNTATITWASNEASSSQVEYGATEAYGSTTTEADTSTGVISHTVALSGLTPGTTYHYRVKGKDQAGNQGVSGDGTLATLSTGIYLPFLAKNSSRGW